MKPWIFPLWVSSFYLEQSLSVNGSSRGEDLVASATSPRQAVLQHTACSKQSENKAPFSDARCSLFPSTWSNRKKPERGREMFKNTRNTIGFIQEKLWGRVGFIDHLFPWGPLRGGGWHCRMPSLLAGNKQASHSTFTLHFR